MKNSAGDDLVNPGKIRDLLEDIETIREAKIQDLLKNVTIDDKYIKVAFLKKKKKKKFIRGITSLSLKLTKEERFSMRF